MMKGGENREEEIGEAAAASIRVYQESGRVRI
jgi:hypothetical protein